MAGAVVTTPRWLVVLAWAAGGAGLYVLAGLAHAALVEGTLTVEIGFGRSLAFWVGAAYAGLLLWGLLPARPSGWYARRRLVLAAAAVGAVAALSCVGLAAAWLARYWVPSVGGPVVASLAVFVLAAAGVLWLAGREERPESV